MPKSADNWLCGFLGRDLRTFLACFRQANRNGLLATLHFPSLAATSGAKGATLFPRHCARNYFSRRVAILSAIRSSSRWHSILPRIRVPRWRGGCAYDVLTRECIFFHLELQAVPDRPQKEKRLASDW